jgi:hypothetical protein
MVRALWGDGGERGRGGRREEVNAKLAATNFIKD